MENILDRRKFVSFGGKCPFACLHCYTYSDSYEVDPLLEIEQMIKDMEKDEGNFDIVYVSGHRENFISPDEGILLCEKIFQRFNVDILFTTRNVFNVDQLNRIGKLNQLMQSKGKDLFGCVSIPAYSSYRKIESNTIIPSPDKRIEFLKGLYEQNIYTLLTIRPLFPDAFISIKEPISIIEKCKDFSSVVLSSGVVVDNCMSRRMNHDFSVYKQEENKLMNCLKRNMHVSYIDVEYELDQIRQTCDKYGLHMEEHSLPAIEFLKETHNL